MTNVTDKPNPRVGVDEPKVEVCRIGPDRAAKWLEKNHERNRRRRPAKVAEYAADMRAGRWVLSNQVISFDPDGTLLNGQHTLEAVVKSGVTIRCIVLWNCPAAAVLVMDGGMKRSTDDHFGMAGKSYPAGCGSTVRRVLMGHGNFAGGSISDLRVDEFMQQHGATIRFVHTATAKNRYAPAPVRAVLVRAMLSRRAVGERVERFADVLATGIMAAGENGAVLLRNHILAEKSAAAGSGTARANLYGLAESAVRAFLDRDGGRVLKPAKAELFPIPGDQ